MRCWTQWWRDWRTLSGGASTARKLWWTRPWWGDTARSTSIAVTHAMSVERKPRPGMHWRFTPEDIMEVELASTTCNTKSCFDSPLKYWENSTWLTFLDLGNLVGNKVVLYTMSRCLFFPPPHLRSFLSPFCRPECCPGVNDWKVGVWVIHLQHMWENLHQQVKVYEACWSTHERGAPLYDLSETVED